MKELRIFLECDFARFVRFILEHRLQRKGLTAEETARAILAEVGKAK